MDILRHPKLVAVFLAFSLLAGCATAPDSPSPLPPSNVKPYASATRAVIPSETVSATDIPIPTSTPSTYTVKSGDTLGQIAEHFGLRLVELQAANPGVVSESLTVGQKLEVPASSSEGNPTPAPASVNVPSCYPSGSGMYCLALVRNPFPDTLENVKLQMTLLDARGHPLASLEAFTPLNILPPGSALPAYAFFPAQADTATPTVSAQPVAQLATAIRLTPDDERYLPATVRNLLVSIAWDGRSARAQGQVFLPANVKSAVGTLWLAAVAYDVDGQVVGFRRWEWQGRLRPGRTQPFDILVYSLGPVIEKIDVVVEARP